MKALIISSIFLIVFLLGIGHISITFKPFCISLPYWHRSLGILLLIISLVIYSMGERGSGYKDGLEKGSEMTLKAVEDLIYEQKQDKK